MKETLLNLLPIACVVFLFHGATNLVRSLETTDAQLRSTRLAFFGVEAMLAVLFGVACLVVCDRRSRTRG